MWELCLLLTEDSLGPVNTHATALAALKVTSTFTRCLSTREEYCSPSRNMTFDKDVKQLQAKILGELVVWKWVLGFKVY